MARGDNVTVTPGINVRPDAGGLQGGEQQDQSSEIGGGLSASRPEDNQAQTGQSSSNNQAAVDESAAAAAAAAKEAERRRKEDEWRRRKEEIDRRREERKGRAKTFIPDAEVESEADLRGLDIYDPEVIAAVRKEMEEERFGPQVKEPEVTAHGLASEIADEFLPPVANSLEDGGEPVEQMLTQVPEGVVDNATGELYGSTEDYAEARSPEKTGVTKKRRGQKKSPRRALGKSLTKVMEDSEGRYSGDPVLNGLGNNIIREGSRPEEFNSEPVDKRLLGYKESRDHEGDLAHRFKVNRDYKKAHNKAKKAVDKREVEAAKAKAEEEAADAARQEFLEAEEQYLDEVGTVVKDVSEALKGINEAMAEQEAGHEERVADEVEVDEAAANIVDEVLTGKRVNEANNPQPNRQKETKRERKKRESFSQRWERMDDRQRRNWYYSDGKIPYTDLEPDLEKEAEGDYFRSLKEKRLDRIMEDWNNFQKWYVQCDIPLAHDEFYLDENTGEARRKRSRAIQDNMVKFARFLSENSSAIVDPRDPLFQTFYNITASKHLGVCYDSNGRLLGAKEDEDIPVIDDQLVIDAINSIMRNIRAGVHPHFWNLYNARIGSTKCYPMPVMTKLEMMYYTAMNRGYDEARLIDGARFVWNSQIYHDLSSEENKAQKRVLETNMSYLLHHVGIEDTRTWGVPNINDRPLYEQFEDWVVDGTYKVWGPDTEEYTRMAFARQRRVLLDAAKTRHAPIGPDGEYLSAEDIRDNYAVVALENAANFMAFSSIFADVMLAGSNAVEAVKGNVWHIAGNRLRMANLSEDERPTDYLYAIAETKQAREFLKAIDLVEYAAGGDALWVYLQETESPTVYNAEQWVKSKYGGVSGGKATEVLKKLSKRMHAIQSGEWITKRSDLKLLIENYLINQHQTRNANALAAAAGEAVKKNVTGIMLDEAFRGSRLAYGDAGINRAFRDMMLDHEGQNAYHMMKQRTMGGVHVTTARYSKWALKHTTEANLIRIFCSPFMEFAVEAAVRLNPLMNTTQWFTVARAAKKAAGVKPEEGEVDETGSTPTQEEVTWAQLRRGGGGIAEQEYACYLASTQLRENLKLDAMRFAGTFTESVIFCLSFLLILGAAHDPDDEKKRFLYDEIVFGAEYDENGNRIAGTGVSFSFMWYLDDLFGPALPFAVAMATFMENRDLEQAVAITMDGMFDIFDGTMPGKIAKLATNWRDCVLEAQALAASSGNEDAEDWVVEPDNTFDYVSTLMKVGLLDIVTDIPNIRFFESLINGGMNDDDYAVNPFKKYDDDHEGLVAVTDYTEQRLRILCANNWLAGVVMNLFTGFYNQDESKPYKTGYTSNDQPLMTVRDIVQSAYYEKTKDVELVFGEDGKWSIGSDDETTLNAVRWVMDILGKCESPQYAAENGVCVSAGARYATICYCYNEIGLLWDQYYDTINGYTGTRDSSFYQWKQEKYEEMEQAQAYFYSTINKLTDWDIPDYPQEYYQIRTNYQKLYTNEDGSPSNGFVWTARNLPVIKEAADAVGLANVNVEYTQYGDFNDPLQLMASPVASGGTGYDWQTLCAWQGECTDPEFIKEAIGDTVLTYTENKGENTWDVATGYGGAVLSDGSVNFVIGERAYVPKEQQLRYDYKVDPYNDDLWLPEGSKVSSYYSSGKDDDSSSSGSGTSSGSGSSYSYGKSYSSGSSSGSSYSPKIYYTSRSVSADKAASMYAKTPYTASTTYLRPAFYTKGSREAYRRQDM